MTRFYCGVDLGQAADYTAIAVLERVVPPPPFDDRPIRGDERRPPPPLPGGPIVYHDGTLNASRSAQAILLL